MLQTWKGKLKCKPWHMYRSFFIYEYKQPQRDFNIIFFASQVKRSEKAGRNECCTHNVQPFCSQTVTIKPLHDDEMFGCFEVLLNRLSKRKIMMILLYVWHIEVQLFLIKRKFSDCILRESKRNREKESICKLFRLLKCWNVITAALLRLYSVVKWINKPVPLLSLSFQPIVFAYKLMTFRQVKRKLAESTTKCMVAGSKRSKHTIKCRVVWTGEKFK